MLSLVRCLAFLALICLVCGCGEHSTPGASASGSGELPVEAVQVPIGSDAWRSLSAARRASWIRQLQASAGPEYAVTEAKSGALSAVQGDMHLRTTFEPGRVSIVVGGEDDGHASEPFELAVAAWGCASDMREVGIAAPKSSPGQTGAVAYSHGEFDEWYAVGPAGVEQGFTVRALPACAQRGEKLRIRLRFADIDRSIATVSSDGSEALLTTPGRSALHYSDPFAQDAAGKEHAVQLGADDGLWLEIDAAETALPLLVDPIVWMQRYVVRDPDPIAGDSFGRAVALSGDTALIGSPGHADHGAGSGAAHVLVRTPSTQVGLPPVLGQPFKLLASDGAAGDAFGGAVALFGDTAVIGAAADDDKGTDSGSVYVFTRSGSSWVQQQKLVPIDLGAGDHFGASLALSSDTLVVGAPQQAGTALPGVGAAYVFARTGTVWGLQSKLTPPASVVVATLGFGAGLALSSDTAAVGTDSVLGGSVNWYKRAGTTWNIAGTGLTSSTAHFGSALAMTDSVTAIGAFGDTTKGVDAGAVSIANTVAPHTPLSTVLGSDVATGDRFGYALTMAGSNLVVGSPDDDDTCPTGNKPCPNAGSIYVFSLLGSVWTQQAKLFGSETTAGAEFGSALAINANTVFVGTPLENEPGQVGGGSTLPILPSLGLVFEEGFGLSNGSACSQWSDCGSSNCVEGVCCNDPCTGPCSSCLAALKGAPATSPSKSTGTCGAVIANTDPKDACPNDGTECGRTGLCAAGAVCAQPQTGTACGNDIAACASATASSTHSACHSLTCTPIPIDCDPGYLCASGACKTSCATDADCDAVHGFSCVAGSCSASLGEAGAGGEAGVGGAEPVGGTGGAGAGAGGAPMTSAGSSGNGTVGGSSVAGSGGTSGGVSAGNSGTSSNAGAAHGGTSGNVNGGSGGTSGNASAGAPAGGNADSAGSAGEAAALMACVPACANGQECDHESGLCRDLFVTACGCRAAGGRGLPLSAFPMLGVLALGLVRRRRRASVVEVDRQIEQ